MEEYLVPTGFGEDESNCFLRQDPTRLRIGKHGMLCNPLRIVAGIMKQPLIQKRRMDHQLRYRAGSQTCKQSDILLL